MSVPVKKSFGEQILKPANFEKDELTEDQNERKGEKVFVL